jgi:hypothetical protein
MQGSLCCAGGVAATVQAVRRSAFDQDIWIIGVLLALLGLLHIGTITQHSRRDVVVGGDETALVVEAATFMSLVAAMNQSLPDGNPAVAMKRV